MTKADEGELVTLRELWLHAQQMDKIRRKHQHLDEARRDADVEDERALAWLTSPKHDELWSDEARTYVVPSVGWPSGYVRKDEREPKPEPDAPPDTTMHKMLREKSSLP